MVLGVGWVSGMNREGPCLLPCPHCEMSASHLAIRPTITCPTLQPVLGECLLSRTKTFR